MSCGRWAGTLSGIAPAPGCVVPARLGSAGRQRHLAWPATSGRLCVWLRAARGWSWLAGGAENYHPCASSPIAIHPTSTLPPQVGAEYGTTTGRPRRIGWLDMVALKFASR